MYSQKKWENLNTYEQVCLFRFINIRSEYVKTKIWWKCKTLLYGCRQLHWLCKNRWYLQKILQKVLKQDLILQILKYRFDRPLPKGKNKEVTGIMKDKLGGKIMEK